MKHIQLIETILFVQDQEVSMSFYKQLFRQAPNLHVPGMTEFEFAPNCKLGLMPSTGVTRILGDNVPSPSKADGIPRCELYLYVEDITYEYTNALKAGATLMSEIAMRNWGDKACYFSDPDGHIIAFAEKAE